MKNIILTLFLLFSMVNILTPTQSYAMSLDDAEEDMEDAEDYTHPNLKFPILTNEKSL